MPEVELGHVEKVKYTIQIHRAMFTDEFFALYKRYELAVHKKEREPA